MLRLDVGNHATPSARLIKKAVEIIHRGGIAAYPTDTVYALGCALESKTSIQTIYRAKKMPENQKLSIVCPDLSCASEYAYLSQSAFHLAKRIFPGPYTLIVPASRRVPRLALHKKQKTIGLRIPDNPVVMAMLQMLGRPLLTTSAVDPESRKLCSDAQEVENHYAQVLDVLVDGGPTGDEASTVIQAIGEEFEIIRSGKGPTDEIFFS